MNPREACGEHGSFLIFSKDIARVAGGLEEGIFFQYVLFRLENRDSAVCLSAKEVEEETLLTWARQARAREVLCERGLLLEKKQGIPARIFFRVDLDKYREIALQNRPQTASVQALAFPESLDQRKAEPWIEESPKLGSDLLESNDQGIFDSVIKESPIHSYSQELVRTNTENDLCEALREDKKPEPKTKPQAQPSLPLPAAEVTTTQKRSSSVIAREEAVARLEAEWVRVWGKGEQVSNGERAQRLKVFEKGLKTYGEAKAMQLLRGHAKSDWHRMKKRSDPQYAFRDTNTDPFMALADGETLGGDSDGGTGRGGGRGGDRAHGGSGEVLSGQAALDKVAAETRARRERDRKQAEESSTPEAIEARRLAFEAMDAITARKGGGRR